MPIHYQILFGEKASKLPFDVTLIHFDGVQIIYHRVYNICICLNTLEKVQIDRNDNLKKSLKLTIGKSTIPQSILHHAQILSDSLIFQPCHSLCRCFE